MTIRELCDDGNHWLKQRRMEMWGELHRLPS